jgi:hypothetical protein
MINNLEKIGSDLNLSFKSRQQYMVYLYCPFGIMIQFVVRTLSLTETYLIHYQEFRMRINWFSNIERIIFFHIKRG